jgi:hypothetical protein
MRVGAISIETMQDVAVPYARSSALSEEKRKVLFDQTAATTRPAGDGVA